MAISNAFDDDDGREATLREMAAERERRAVETRLKLGPEMAGVLDEFRERFEGCKVNFIQFSDGTETGRRDRALEWGLAC